MELQSQVEQLVRAAVELVNTLVEELSRGAIGLKEVEDRILALVNRLGALLLSEVVALVAEPTTENEVYVDGKKARYKDGENLRFISRFGEEVVRRRRVYKVEGEEGRYAPLDEKLGLDRCRGFSVLMSYLLCLFGGDEAFEGAAEKLTAALGFVVSATAVERNTEAVGKRMDDHPLRLIRPESQSEASDLMVVEMDGIVSPQIHEEEGIRGTESLKQPTEYKECNVATIAKYKRKLLAKELEYHRVEHWVGATYGERAPYFEPILREAGLAMGQLRAEQIVVVADGTHSNWEFQLTNFPTAVAILDLYHAFEHLGKFCALFRDAQEGRSHYASWRTLLYEGQCLQMLAEMKGRLAFLSDTDEGQKEINYFSTNKDRMAYDLYRARGYPIGSGMVEGACKYVVAKRFKGSGMRWKKADNQAVLRVRIAYLNGRLEEHFQPKPRLLTFVPPGTPLCERRAARA